MRASPACDAGPTGRGLQGPPTPSVTQLCAKLRKVSRARRPRARCAPQARPQGPWTPGALQGPPSPAADAADRLRHRFWALRGQERRDGRGASGAAPAVARAAHSSGGSGGKGRESTVSQGPGTAEFPRPSSHLPADPHCASCIIGSGCFPSRCGPGVRPAGTARSPPKSRCWTCMRA